MGEVSDRYLIKQEAGALAAPASVWRGLLAGATEAATPSFVSEAIDNGRCPHDWELVRRYEVPDSDGGFPPGLNSHMRPVYVSRCKLCDQRKTEPQE
jgi:hypothetical protein